MGKCWLPNGEWLQWMWGNIRGKSSWSNSPQPGGSLQTAVSGSVTQPPHPLIKTHWETIKQTAASGKIHQNLICWTKGDKMARNRPQRKGTVRSGWDFSFHPLPLLSRPIHQFFLRLLIRETPATPTQPVNYENQSAVHKITWKWSDMHPIN